MKVGDRRADWRPEPCVVASREAAGDRPGRRGLTLLEVLLATALSVVLLAALYAVLHLQYRYWTRLDVRTQQTQLTRSLYVMLQADLRGCVFRPPEQEDSGISTPEPSEESAEAGAGAEVGGTVEDEEVVVGVSDPLSAWGSGLTGLVGTADVLVLQTAQTESAYGGASEGADEFDALAAELGLDAAAGLPESPTLRAVAYCTGDSPGGAEFVQSLLDGGATVVGEDAGLADLGPLPGLYRVSAPFSVWENS
ncbi:MAG: prepilin-type N-terminal cleavage/methylation domain-containing protein, partial [Planctomycetota bacterium]